VEVVPVIDCRVRLQLEPVSPHDNARFVAMLPLIRKFVRFAFRSGPRATRHEQVNEALAQAFVLFAHLAKRKLVHLAHPTALARYAAHRVRSGRKIGSRQNGKETLSRAARRRFGFRVVSIEERATDGHSNWIDLVSATRRTTPADLAALRIDFAEWLAALSPRQRQIALCLAVGERTSAVAARQRVTPARISQIRRELADGWERFQGEVDRNSSPSGDRSGGYGPSSRGARGSSVPEHGDRRRRTGLEWASMQSSQPAGRAS
jgi:hypothetical protein